MALTVRTEPLAPVDWIQAAIQAVNQDGAGGVRIDRLCRELGVTKGSFYHHFQSRADLVEAVARYWADTQPQMVIDHVQAMPDAPWKRLLALTRLFTDLDLGIRDHAMRAWGASEPRIHEAVNTADRRIVRLLESMLADLGLPRQQQHDFARVLMFCSIGFYTAPELVNDQGRDQIARHVLALIRRAGTSDN